MYNCSAGFYTQALYIFRHISIYLQSYFLRDIIPIYGNHAQLDDSSVNAFIIYWLINVAITLVQQLHGCYDTDKLTIKRFNASSNLLWLSFFLIYISTYINCFKLCFWVLVQAVQLLLIAALTIIMYNYIIIHYNNREVHVMAHSLNYIATGKKPKSMQVIKLHE